MTEPIAAEGKADPSLKLPGYWLLQFAGWAAFAILSILSLNAWYNPGELAPALHSLVQSLLGVVVSHPLRWVARRTWNVNLPLRIVLNALAIILASQVWTILRLYAFTLMTGVAIGPEDWGGWIFGSLTVFASWAFCYHAIKYYRQWIQQSELSIKAQNAALAAEARAQRELVRRLHAESLVRESKLRLLNYQLNPHFFFNALNSVTALVQRGDKDGATEMLLRIGNFLRVTLEEDATSPHPLRDEAAILQQYLDIERVRFGDRVNSVFDISPAAGDVLVPGLILQPLIENSIKHAVGRSLEPTTITLAATVLDERLNIQLTDASAGTRRAPSGAAALSPGIGIKNVEERLKSVYGSDYIFTASRCAETAYRVEISLPLRPAPSLADNAGAMPATSTPAASSA